MTLIQLEYIVAVDTYRHFAKAAEKCFITQPTLSMQIQKLEETLGVIIFDRSKQPVVPTEIGEAIIKQARVVLAEAKKIQELIDDEKQELSGEIRLGIIPTLAPYLLPLFITNFIEKYPKVNIQVEEMLTDQVVHSLKNDLTDIGIIVTPTKEKGLIEKPIFYEEFFAYISNRHALSKKGEVDANEIKGEDLWLLNEGHCFREQALNICGSYRENQAHPNFKYESGSLEALRKIVDKQKGLTLLPELATLDLSLDDKKKLHGFAEPKPIREVSIVMHRSFLKRKIVEALYDEIQNTLPLNMKSKKSRKVINWKK
ncbi:LysR substrate-binding domain-containing protein [Fulvivirgaceae bacterium BMA10]|uniref:LysR substrate-binding domain-containing protein n=1 Tax=Splendidivirga corallicola TaxID=3051826 RepID=A0ABT8KM03_9BACT|nr:LysR substrate-binding domain-containing protein [Fulvivirgaceae bacterium BMA10]